MAADHSHRGSSVVVPNLDFEDFISCDAGLPGQRRVDRRVKMVEDRFLLLGIVGDLRVGDRREAYIPSPEGRGPYGVSPLSSGTKTIRTMTL
jgi:hypothetical protein